MRIAWRTIGAIIRRVCADIGMAHDRLGGLRRIGIGEISDKRGHKYLTVVVDHDRRLVWATPGRDKATLGTFFDALGADRCAQITDVTVDAADWIAAAVKQRCPTAVRCADAFHVVAWATDALDQVRGRPGMTPAGWPEASPRAAPGGPAKTAGRPPAHGPVMSARRP